LLAKHWTLIISIAKWVFVLRIYLKSYYSASHGVLNNLSYFLVLQDFPANQEHFAPTQDAMVFQLLQGATVGLRVSIGVGANVGLGVGAPVGLGIGAGVGGARSH
jgi:hypothetical protein